MKIDPIVHIFEPVLQFAQICRDRFKDYPRVSVHEYGLTNFKTRRTIISVDEAASSVHLLGDKPKQEIFLRDINAVLDDLDIRFIELMNINIEGEEYALLHRMVTNGVAKRTKNIQVQFHSFVPDAERRRNSIREQLSVTHKENFAYPFIWESWSLK
jgi:hypothetical protein